MRWRVSAWTHPASGNFQCIHHSVPIVGGTFSDPEEPRGRMSFSVPVAPTETAAGIFSWRDLINSDPGTPANNRNSLIRVYRDGVDNTGEPDMEFYVERWQRRITDDGVEVMQISGPDWRVAGLDPATLRWLDWEPGATLTRQSDWSYGGSDQRNLLKNLDFDTDGVSEKQQYHVHGSAGTYTITIAGFGTTPGLAPYEAGGRASDVEAAIEALPGITDVKVTGKGHTQYDPLVVEFLDPLQDFPQISLDETNLTHGGCAHPPCHNGVVATLRAGEFSVDPWTPNQSAGGTVSSIHGLSDIDVVDDPDPVEAGDLAISVDMQRSNGGVQQVIEDAEPGFAANAKVELRSSSTTDEFQIQIRDGNDGWIDASPIFTLAVADTWEEFAIDQLTLPDKLPKKSIIWRIVCSSADGDSVPSDFLMRNPWIAYGFGPATIGVISNQIIADAQVDHAPTLVRIPWVTEGAYTDLVASGGDDWIREEHLVLRRGRKYGKDIYAGQFYDLGYIHDLIPGDGTGGRTTPDQANWYLEIYNPNTQGETLTETAFLLAMGIDGGMVAGRIPAQTRVLLEGADGLITELADTTQEGIFGVHEQYIPEPDITDLSTLQGRASVHLNRDLANVVAITAELDPDAPIPYVDFQRGDTAPFVAGSYFTRHTRRISEITLSADMSSEGELHWTPSITASKLLTGDRAKNEGLYRLLSAFEPFPDDEKGEGGGIAQAFPIPVLAASNAPTWMQQGARWVCDGSSDQVTIATALTEMAGRGNIYMTPGDFNINMTAFAQGGPGLDVPTGTNLIGAGADMTRINLVDADATAITQPLIEQGAFSTLRDFYVQSWDGVTAIKTSSTGHQKIDRVHVDNSGGGGIGIHVDTGDIVWISECVVEGAGGANTDPAIRLDTNAQIIWIDRCRIQNGVNNIHATGTNALEIWITDNQLASAASDAILIDHPLGPFGLRITNNNLDNWGLEDVAPLSEAGIRLRGVAGAIIDGTPTESGYGALIADNYMEAAFGHGIVLENITGATVRDNYIEDADGHGIWLAGDTDHSTVADNRIFMSANENPGNVWDMIHVDGSENIIKGNTTRDSESGTDDRSRYALVLDGNENWVFDNDFRGTGQTGEILDNGTGNELLGQHATWIDYTPTWTAPTTNPVLNSGTLVGRYKVIDGNTITGHLRLVIAADTTLGSGEWQFDLPVDPAPAYDHALGSAHVEDVGTGWHTGVGIWNDTDGVVNVIDSGGAGLLDATIPIAWATDDVLTVGFSYEIP